MHRWRGIGNLVIFATIGEKEKFPPPLRAGRRNAYKEDARSSLSSVEFSSASVQFQLELSSREILIACVGSFTDKYR